MTRIVTTTYRYKRPPPKRKAVSLDVPVIVRKSESHDSETDDDVDIAAPSDDDDRPEATSPHHGAKSAIVTIKRKSRFGDAPDLTPEEHQRRGRRCAVARTGCGGRPPSG